MAKSNSKQKKMDIHVDFTPMVDMNMLLICFFMLCSSMITPQSMEINMPSNKDDIKEDQQNKVKASEAVTLILDGESKLYYFEGIPEIDGLKETNYTQTGLRSMLLKRNAVAVQKIKKLKADKASSQTSNVNDEAKVEAQYKKDLLKIKTEKGVPNVIIKATDAASYKNLIDALDEMQICGIGKYVIDKITDFDKQMIAHLKGKGASAPAPAPAQ
ncbi:MAG: biopolymer transporter ExbD [Bacteroidaceae bacterium]